MLQSNHISGSHSHLVQSLTEATNATFCKTGKIVLDEADLASHLTAEEIAAWDEAAEKQYLESLELDEWENESTARYWMGKSPLLIVTNNGSVPMRAA